MNDQIIDVNKKIRSIQDTMYVTGGKWKISILTAIYLGNKRFTDIKNCVDGITPKILSKELKNLEMNKLIVRIVSDTYPTTISYESSEYCKSLSNVIKVMADWGEEHRKKI